MKNWSEFIFNDEPFFEEKAKQVFKHQFKHNAVYRNYCEALDVGTDILEGVQYDINQVPLLPIKAFKDTTVTSSPDKEPELTFKSSGTSDMQRSIHTVVDASLYEESLLRGFQQFYELEDTVIWGYTPGYSDNPDSSLVYMIQKLIDQDNSGLSRFLPLDEPINPGAVKEVKRQRKQLIIFGAAFGLLDLLELQDIDLPSDSIIIETGGMKTYKREISRVELHKKLASGFGLNGNRIHSEYGMAELLSQAYATGGQWFNTVPWMQVSIRNPQDPAEVLSPFDEGLIGIIDLANVHSCSFLLTDDMGVMDERGRFKVLGRRNPNNPRGCNFLIEVD
ncbi:hypothetical protein [Fodinibius halophilus]|uniref:Acyl-protein synthetase LuxE domain-containing protein n=1 Tax=Fodinibius halophilus TaxID=1736908 RepID=A0A6M1SSA6_9BACT|nr:hypothetical protein [Fodinibius halophilus]NGP86808.1 hypothetical protein [Fodinibius halophilus]